MVRGAEEREQQAENRTRNVFGVRVSIPQLVPLIPSCACWNRPSRIAAGIMIVLRSRRRQPLHPVPCAYGNVDLHWK
jgi:hypothetical protein